MPGPTVEMEPVEPQSLKKLSFKSLKRALDLFAPIHGHFAPPDLERYLFLFFFIFSKTLICIFFSYESLHHLRIIKIYLLVAVFVYLIVGCFSFFICLFIYFFDAVKGYG